MSSRSLNMYVLRLNEINLQVYVFSLQSKHVSMSCEIQITIGMSLNAMIKYRESIISVYKEFARQENVCRKECANYRS